MRTSLSYLGLLCLLGFWSSCTDDPKPIDKKIPVGRKVLVVNEGNFQRGNASLGLYQPNEKIYTSDVFKNANNIPLGDVFQSITKVNGEHWLVLNNSGRIMSIDTTNYTVTGTIEDLVSPRYALYMNGLNKVYVSDLYSDKITVVNADTKKKLGQIPCSGWTDRMILAGGLIYVCNRTKPYVYLIDPEIDAVVDSIKVSNNASAILFTELAEVVVLCEGAVGSNEPAALYKIDPKAHQLSWSHTFKKNEHPKFLSQTPVAGEVFFMNSQLYKLQANNQLIQETRCEVVDQGNLYGLSFDPLTQDLYFLDARDFIQSSIITRLSASFVKLDEFKVGVNCNGLLF
ncbi:MAG: DNA-binding beta-propeller fold protein YncE [Bacteroidia bacterium]|jgi:DNA-binding beta-propeller fold protein YncE